MRIRQRKPDWLKIDIPTGATVNKLRKMMVDLRLNTVCQEAQCPNMGECWARGTATFMILGDRCTRNCRFCAVETARPCAVDHEEPTLVAEAVETLNLRHAVITSVARDDLGDGGARHFVDTIRAIRARTPGVSVEVLIPDFRGARDALRVVVEAGPDILNHNVETVPRLYRRVRPQAIYERSVDLLARVKKLDPDMYTKSGMMLGLGETREEVEEVMQDLVNIGCDFLTLGQYLRPSMDHLPVERYIPPAEFDGYRDTGEAMGFRAVYAGPLVRSSYNAGRVFDEFRVHRSGSESRPDNGDGSLPANTSND